MDDEKEEQEKSGSSFTSPESATKMTATEASQTGEGDKAKGGLMVALIAGAVAIIVALIGLVPHISPHQPPSPTPTPTPPDGFVSMGERSLETEGKDGADKTESRSWQLPPDVKVDTSFRQTDLSPISGGGATPTLTAGNMPPGFRIRCHGDDTKGRRWAILVPGGTPIFTQQGNQGDFTLGLYADTGHPGLGGGCTVVAEVSYKPAK